MSKFIKNWWWILLLGLVIFVIFIRPIDLVTADLGRHIKNGQLTFETGSVQNGNIFSYTYNDYTFVNHHWLSGVVFYLLYILGGFETLSVFFALISAVTVIVFLSIRRQKTGWLLTLASLLIYLPLIIYRQEIRPEIFSSLLVGVTFLLLWKYQNDNIGWKWLLLIPLAGLFWVNLHIYFILVFLFVGAFWFENLIGYIKTLNKAFFTKLKFLTLIGFVSAGAVLINPNYLEGTLRPFQIYTNYGYRVLEEQNLAFLQDLMSLPVINYYWVGLVVLIISWLLAGWAIRKGKQQFHISLLLISIVFSILGFLMLRNLSLFGLVAMSVVMINLAFTRAYISSYNYFVKISGLIVVSVIIFSIGGNYWENRIMLGVGLIGGNDSSAKFFIENNLKGPIFNNYDIGGYLIFYLYPKEKMFVDNRPDAYPAEFFNQVYIPMQESNQIWQEIDNHYNFQSIYFYRHDATPWAQNFLNERLKDPKWIPVYVDDWVLIIVKKDGVNQLIAQDLALPKEMFVAR